MAVSFKGAHFPPEVILMGVRWYVAYPLSTRHVEELMAERGVDVDHSTINRWTIHIPPELVVKRQVVDIFEVISSPIWQRNIVQTSYRNRKWQCEPLSHRRSIGLPLIPVECALFFGT
jgi:hypothetical protein